MASARRGPTPATGSESFLERPDSFPDAMRSFTEQNGLEPLTRTEMDRAVGRLEERKD